MTNYRFTFVSKWQDVNIILKAFRGKKVETNGQLLLFISQTFSEHSDEFILIPITDPLHRER